MFTTLAQLKDWSPTTAAGVINPNGGCLVDGVPTLKCAEIVFGNLLFMSSALIILVLFVMFVIGAFNYLTSFGNAEKIKKAQGTFRFALIGFGLFISAFLILKTIDIIFLGNQGKIFNFEIPAP
ncbi:hypothetical protein HY214_04245 [Candidatus Roizmanbacteria bacterium]|nr:hypothetical protein [Candidatus Roizmanbacteria bacterium]